MKKWLLVILTAIIISSGFPQAKAHADSIHPPLLQKNPHAIHTINQSRNPVLTKPASVSDQLIQVVREIKNNKRMLEQTDLEFQVTQSEGKQLNAEILNLQDKISQRTKILKARAQAYQQSGTNNINYIDVLLGSTSLMDFVSRIGAVSQIVEADKKVLEDQEAAQIEIQAKKRKLQEKLEAINSMKRDLEGMSAHLEQQQNRYLKLKKQIERENSHPQQISVATNVGDGYIMKVINAGYRYIGRSTYVFGGGRTASDAANGRFDCSGFVHWAFAQAGIEIGSTTDSIKTEGKRVSLNEMRPGDLVFFDTYKKDGHIGIYLGNGKFLGSQNSTGVAIVDMTKGYWKAKFNGRVIRI